MHSTAQAETRLLSNLTDLLNEAPRSKLRGITEHSFEDFSETELNPVASYGEYSSLTQNLHS